MDVYKSSFRLACDRLVDLKKENERLIEDNRLLQQDQENINSKMESNKEKYLSKLHVATETAKNLLETMVDYWPDVMVMLLACITVYLISTKLLV